MNTTRTAINPLIAEENLEVWFEFDPKYRSSKKSALSALYTELPQTQSSLTTLFNSTRMYLLKHAFASISLLIIILSGMTVTAAEVFAPQEYKPSTTINRIFNPDDFKTNTLPEKNPYTALAPDSNNDVVSFEACDISIKYPNSVRGSDVTSYDRGESTYGVPSHEFSIQSSDYIINYNTATTIECFDRADFNSLTRTDPSRIQPGENDIVDTQYERVTFPKYQIREEIDTQTLQAKTGWFITQSKLEDIRIIQKYYPVQPSGYELESDSLENSRENIIFSHGNNTYILTYNTRDQQKEDISASQELTANEKELFLKTNTPKKIKATEIQLQFDSLTDNTSNASIQESLKAIPSPDLFEESAFKGFGTISGQVDTSITSDIDQRTLLLCSINIETQEKMCQFFLNDSGTEYVDVSSFNFLLPEGEFYLYLQQHQNFLKNNSVKSYTYSEYDDCISRSDEDSCPLASKETPQKISIIDQAEISNIIFTKQ